MSELLLCRLGRYAVLVRPVEFNGNHQCKQYMPRAFVSPLLYYFGETRVAFCNVDMESPTWTHAGTYRRLPIKPESVCSIALP